MSQVQVIIVGDMNRASVCELVHKCNKCSDNVDTHIANSKYFNLHIRWVKVCLCLRQEVSPDLSGH